MMYQLLWGGDVHLLWSGDPRMLRASALIRRWKRSYENISSGCPPSMRQYATRAPCAGRSRIIGKKSRQRAAQGCRCGLSVLCARVTTSQYHYCIACSLSC